jgi:aldose 1-epimerase
MAPTKPPLTIGESGGLEATFLPGLGMVCSSLRFRGRELLELRGGPEAYADRGSTFGIPLLAPWANRLGGWEYEAAGVRVQLDRDSPYIHIDGGTGLPIHGLLAASPLWSVVESDVSELRAALEFAPDAGLLAAFPFPHRLELRASIGAARLSIELTLTPTGEVMVPVCFGFHPYLRLPDSDRREWTVSAPVRRRLVLDQRGLPTGATEELAHGALSGPLGDRTFDDCFDQLEPRADGSPLEFAVADGRLRLAVEFVSGFPVAQLYAPAGSEFICFEPMTAPVDALRDGHGLRFATPGEKFFAEFAVTATQLESS